MINRLTACAAVFAVLSAATITFASNTSLTRDSAPRIEAAAMSVVHLARVEVTGSPSPTNRSSSQPTFRAPGRSLEFTQRPVDPTKRNNRSPS